MMEKEDWTLVEPVVLENNKEYSCGNGRRIILVGKAGNGKSSTGNSILAYPGFKFMKSMCSVTQNCEKRTSITRKDWPLYEVCDTPGLLDTEVSLVDRVLEIQRALKVCPEPHAFLLVFSSASRMTEDEMFTIDLLRITFGENVFEHCIVVFTRGNEFASDVEFKTFLKASPVLNKLLKKCGNRVTRIENQNSVDNINIGNDMCHLLALIEQVSSDGERVYIYRWLDSHAEALKQHRQNYKGIDGIGTQLMDISDILARELTPNRWTIGLVATALGGVGFAGYGVYVGGTAVVGAVPVIASTVGQYSGLVIGGAVGGFVKMASVGAMKAIQFW